MDQQTTNVLEPRPCAYEQCGREFRPRKSWQRFFCKQHKDAFHKEADNRLKTIMRRYVTAAEVFSKTATDEAAIELAQAKRALWEETERTE